MDRRREQNLDALRKRSREGSPALGPQDAALDYLLGSDGQ